MKQSRKSKPNEPVGLVESLESLSSDQLYALAARSRVPLDKSKRISVETQLARGLVSLPYARNPALLPRGQAELMWRVAEASGRLLLEDLPAAAQSLVELGLLFRRPSKKGILLTLPLAYLVQMNRWDGDDPRGVRALLSQTPAQVATTVAAEYLGRPATFPTCLSLEPALRALMSAEAIARGLSALSTEEHELLTAIDERGGEVDTEELLDLEREPMRLRGAVGVTQSRKSVSFSLERRGFLIPIHPNHHVVPTEVARVVGQSRRQARENSRREIRQLVIAEDHAPRRARFSDDPGSLALAFVLTVRARKTAIKVERGTPKSLVNRLATLHGCSPETAALVVALSRALGLWGDGAHSESMPPGHWTLGDLGERFFQVWRKGGAWDEARVHGELLRVSLQAREASAVGAIRELMLEALCELGEGRWVPWESLAGYLLADTRHEALTRLLSRWANRNGESAISVADVATRIGLHTLFVLGVVDIGDDEGPALGPALRLTPRGKAWITNGPSTPPTDTVFLDDQTLRLGTSARVSQILAVGAFAAVQRATDSLELAITVAGVSAELAAGSPVSRIRGQLSALAPIPTRLNALLSEASAVLGQAEWVPSAGFLWVEDPDLRELLRSKRQTAELFVEPSPPGGLLLRPQVAEEKLVTRCRALGIEVLLEGANLRATAAPAPKPKKKAKAATKKRETGAARRR